MNQAVHMIFNPNAVTFMVAPPCVFYFLPSMKAMPYVLQTIATSPKNGGKKIK